jgi:flavodoxin
MKAIVIFDSHYGNTKLVAATIANKLGDNVPHISVKDLKPSDIDEFDLLVVGSPIIGWKPTEKITKFLISLDSDNSAKLKTMNAAAFDTRVKTFIGGNAANKMAKTLQNFGAKLIVPPMGFYVKEKQAILLDGELEKAENWAKSITSKL